MTTFTFNFLPLELFHTWWKPLLMSLLSCRPFSDFQSESVPGHHQPQHNRWAVITECPCPCPVNKLLKVREVPRFSFWNQRSVGGRLNRPWHYLEEVDIVVLSEPFGLMKHWETMIWRESLREIEKQWCFVDNKMEALVPSWVVYVRESWLDVMIYRPLLWSEQSLASQIWQMSWQVTNS